MDTNRFDPRRRPYLVAAVAYVALHVGIVLVTAVAVGSDLDGLASNGAPSLSYFLLMTAFGAVLVGLSARAVGRRWWVAAAALLVALVGVRYVAPSVGGLLSIPVVFALVLLPVVVLAAVLLRLVVVRLGSARLARLPGHPVTVRALLVVGVVLVATVGGALLAVATAPSAVPPADWSADRQLAYLERTDQADRRTGAFVDGSRDYRRAERVLALLAADRVDSPAAGFDAAVVLQHGNCPEHFELAHRLATAADAAGVDGADRWTRLTYDRWQLSLGNDQRYATQTGSPQVDADCAPPVPAGLNVSAPLAG
jgi:hypothetical protein